MSNPNVMNGFYPFRRLDGGAWTGQVTTYRIQAAYNTPIGQGDPVKIVGGYVNRAAATDTMRGVFMGCRYTDSTGKYFDVNKWPIAQATLGSQDALAQVIDDPNVTYIARFGNAANTPTQADASKSFASFGQGTYTADGRSSTGLDYSTANSSSNQQWCALRFVELPVGSSTFAGNDPAAPYALMEVRVGLHDFKNSAGL